MAGLPANSWIGGYGDARDSNHCPCRCKAGQAPFTKRRQSVHELWGGQPLPPKCVDYAKLGSFE